MNPFEIDIGNFEYVKFPLQLGEHSGNHFKVLLRSLRPKGEREGLAEVEGSLGMGAGLEDMINSSLEAVRRCGFVNYFGQQRLGTRLSGPRIGLALLQDNPVSSGCGQDLVGVVSLFCEYTNLAKSCGIDAGNI